MSLIVEPDLYTPGVSDEGNYVDHIPPGSHFQRGMRCPCSNAEKCYSSRASFVSHTKTASHQRWLLHINSNRANYLKELEEARKLIDQQKRIIAQLEHEVSGLTVAIQTISRQSVVSLQKPEIDLLDF